MKKIKILMLLLSVILSLVSCGEKVPEKPSSVLQFEKYNSIELEYSGVDYDYDMNEYLVYSSDKLYIKLYVENTAPYDIHYGTCYGAKVWENGSVVGRNIQTSQVQSQPSDKVQKNNNASIGTTKGKSYIKPDTWYKYSSNNVVRAQNAEISSAVSTSKGQVFMINYYPVCSYCSVRSDRLDMTGVEIDTPVSEYYTCNECDKLTYIRFKIEY